jgi:hypothetical protein
MKKLFLLTIVVATLVSCGSPKTVLESKKVIKGYWELNSITYSESGKFNVTMLGDASKECFEGSQWRFIPNNNTGVYTIDRAGCDVGDRHFIFTIQEIDRTTGYYDFLLKPTNERKKSESNHGFRMQLSQLSETDMQWQQHLTVEGKPFTIYMNFIKN